MDIEALYRDLIELVEHPKLPFRYRDEELEGRVYRMFSYSAIASYEDFMRPGALECRGHTFEVDGQGRMLRLASLPMPKFFNLGENPATQGLDLGQLDLAMEKWDGSLISTMIHDEQLLLKSKGSLDSAQALAAQGFLDPSQRDQLEDFVRQGWTVNLEWVSPENHVVVPYREPGLVVLNARSHRDGRMRFGEDLHELDRLQLARHVEPPDLDRLEQREGIEGYVLVFSDGQMVKIKTPWYYERHRLRSATLTRRGLWQLALDAELDDVRALYATQPGALERIQEIEQEVRRKLDALRQQVDAFYLAHSELDRKSYALRGQAHEESRALFPLLMRRYTHGQVDYVAYAKKYLDQLILPDEHEPLP